MVPTGSHIETLQIRPRQRPKQQQIMQKAKLEIRTPQGRREERKQKKDADLTTVYVLVWEGAGSRGKNRAKPSCCYGLGFEARLNRQWREGRASGRGSGDRHRTAVARPGRGSVDADGIARRPPAAPMEQPSLGIRTEREGAHASTGGSPAERQPRHQRERARASIIMVG